MNQPANGAAVKRGLLGLSHPKPTESLVTMLFMYTLNHEISLRTLPVNLAPHEDPSVVPHLHLSVELLV